MTREEDGGLPKGIGAPAGRALAAAGITRLQQLTKLREEDVRAMHGVGGKAITVLRAALEARGWGFADE